MSYLLTDTIMLPVSSVCHLCVMLMHYNITTDTVGWCNDAVAILWV